MITLVCRSCGRTREYADGALIFGEPALEWFATQGNECTTCRLSHPPTPVARTTDPGTSWAAANSVTNLRESQSEILRLLREHGPMTDEQIFGHLQTWVDRKGKMISLSGARTRRKELESKGLVADSGERALTKANRQTIIWKVT